jgi:hypothetical protein
VANGPVAAPNVRGTILDHCEQQAEGEYQKRKGPTQSHKRSPLMSLKSAVKDQPLKIGC